MQQKELMMIIHEEQTPSESIILDGQTSTHSPLMFQNQLKRQGGRESIFIKKQITNTNLQPPARCHKDVHRSQISMHNILCVQNVNALSNLKRVIQRLLELERDRKATKHESRREWK
jgi:hypothetical protein